jgi:hypothetical protein
MHERYLAIDLVATSPSADGNLWAWLEAVDVDRDEQFGCHFTVKVPGQLSPAHAAAFQHTTGFEL